MDIPLPAELEAEVRKALQMMLPRPVIDVLVRYFVAEVNWLVSSAPCLLVIFFYYGISLGSHASHT